ncbi:MAG: hypothetical protein WDZ51_06225 [Pirellulaceae bacterium]
MADIRRHEKLPKPDERGRIKAFVGKTEDGKRAVFVVGNRRTTQVESQIRLEKIREIYSQCKNGHWNEFLRQVAIRIGKGEPITETVIPYETSEPTIDAKMMEFVRSLGVPVNFENPEMEREGIRLTNEQLLEVVGKAVKSEIEKLEKTGGPLIRKLATTLPEDDLSHLDDSTLNDAIKAYRLHLEATGATDAQGNLSGYVRKCLDRQKYLKEAHKDIQLKYLTLPKLEEMASHWRNRPQTSKGNRCSKYHARDMLKELWRLLRWINDQPNFRWELPKGADRINRSPIDLPQDNQKGVFQTTTKATYTPEQLGMILENTDAQGKAIISTCVNCAFGASEIGQWSITKFVMNQAHPRADKIGIETTAADSWIVGARPKTGVYGEHLLWEPVAKAIEPFLSDGREVLPMTSKGTKWYQLNRSNPQTKFQRWWENLIKRTQKQYDIPYLPFGSLRDTFPDVLRQKYSDDVASLALHHGSLGEDKLLKCYANLPFKKLFEATRELEEFYQPMLSKL